MRATIKYTVTHECTVDIDVDEAALAEFKRRSKTPPTEPLTETVIDYLEHGADAPDYWENGTIEDLKDRSIDEVTIHQRLAVCLGGETPEARAAYDDILSALPED